MMNVKTMFLGSYVGLGPYFRLHSFVFLGKYLKLFES